MTTLTLDVPPNLYRQLNIEAKRQDKSPQSVAQELLAKQLTASEPTIKNDLDDQINAKLNAWDTLSDKDMAALYNDTATEDLELAQLGLAHYTRTLEQEESVTEMLAEKSQKYDAQNGDAYQYYPLTDHVVRALGVCGGRPTFKYTRVEITGALERLAEGESVEQIVKGYRGRISKEAIIDAVRLVADQFSRTLPELEAA